MKKLLLRSLLFLIPLSLIHAQDVKEEATEEHGYIEFNDRNNVVHGVYLGLAATYGEFNGGQTYGGTFKIAYVLNQKFEVGLALTGFLSDQPFIVSNTNDNDVGGAYIGIHLEPIFFSKRKVSLSFPIFVGAGGIIVTDGADGFDDDFIDTEFENVNVIGAIEPGVSALFNISRYLQLEAGVKYRFTNKIDLATSPIRNLNGFSAGVGIKVGVFNMGRNRYKKKVKN